MMSIIRATPGLTGTPSGFSLLVGPPHGPQQTIHVPTRAALIKEVEAQLAHARRDTE